MISSYKLSWDVNLVGKLLFWLHPIEWVSDCNLSAISWREQVNFLSDDDDEVCFVPDHHAELDFHGASSLNQQSVDRHVAPQGHIILIPSQPVFALTHSCSVLRVEATNTNFIVFGLTRLGLEPTIYRTRGEHAGHYTTDAIHFILIPSQPVFVNWNEL